MHVPLGTNSQVGCLPAGKHLLGDHACVWVRNGGRGRQAARGPALSTNGGPFSRGANRRGLLPPRLHGARRSNRITVGGQESAPTEGHRESRSPDPPTADNLSDGGNARPGHKHSTGVHASTRGPSKLLDKKGWGRLKDRQDLDGSRRTLGCAVLDRQDLPPSEQTPAPLSCASRRCGKVVSVVYQSCTVGTTNIVMRATHTHTPLGVRQKGRTRRIGEA